MCYTPLFSKFTDLISWPGDTKSILKFFVIFLNPFRQSPDYYIKFESEFSFCILSESFFINHHIISCYTLYEILTVSLRQRKAALWNRFQDLLNTHFPLQWRYLTTQRLLLPDPPTGKNQYCMQTSRAAICRHIAITMLFFFNGSTVPVGLGRFVSVS
jgi:hypothetical protein